MHQKLARRGSGARSSLAELRACLDAAEVPDGPINSIAGIFEDPHYIARGTLTDVADPVVGFEVTGDTLAEGDGAVPGFYPSLATAADQWRQLNVKVPLQPFDPGGWLERSDKNDYDLIVSNRGFRGDPIDMLMPAFHSGGVDNQGYTNPQVGQWLDQASTELDRAKRRALYLQVQQQVMADAVWSLLWTPIATQAKQQYVAGYDQVSLDGFKDLRCGAWLTK